MPKKNTIIILVVILLLIGAGVAYWYLFFYGPGNTITPVVTGGSTTTGFRPFSTSGPTTTSTGSGQTETENNGGDSVITNNVSKIASLRLLSNSPIGGYGASTTRSSDMGQAASSTTTVVRWVDRGRGNVYETKGDSEEVVTLSNTILPRMYESVWNRNLTAFIGSILPVTSDIPTTVYAQIKSQIASTGNASSTETMPKNITPYELKGKNLPENMIGYAVSPKGDKVFMLVKESGAGVGYTANFDGTSVVKIFTTPLTQVNVEWPEDTTIAITTKGAANQAGFLYFINTKTGVWKKVLGPIFGLSTKVSHNAKYVIASGTNKSELISTNIYSVGTTTPMETTIRTIADKCVWGNYYKEIVYCAVPSKIESGIYPDDWYKGTVSFTDKIWQVNVLDGGVHLVTTIVDQSDRLIDVFNLGLDTKDDFLFFMNKSDLSFWSFDLNAR